MKKLLNYINGLSKEQRKAFFEKTNTPESYCRSAICRSVTLGAKKCTAIEIASGGAVSRKDLRPHDWQIIWPEIGVTE